MTQEFHLSVTPVGGDSFLVRTERVEAGVPLAEEQLVWPVDSWLQQARQLMNDPVLELLQGASSGDLADLLAAGPPDKPSKSAASLLALGQQLYGSLFQGMIRDSWMAAQSIAQNRREVLRLRLGLQGTRLHQLPWEVLYSSDRPLATGTDITFSRYRPERGVSSFSIDRWTPQPYQPLRILMAIAAPSDQERLALSQEFQHLKTELQRPQATNGQTELSESWPEIEVTLLEQPGREQLTQALEQGNYHVFHYAGHSNLGNSGGNLYLVNPKTGLTETLSGEDLAGLLVNNGIYMAVLNSCRGAYTPVEDLPVEGGEQNLAQALIRRGIPGVLAMAERIPDEVALTFARLLYRNLRQGYPVDLSLSRTRQGLISAYGSHQLYWALPILYLHAEFDGYLTAGDRTHTSSLDAFGPTAQVLSFASPLASLHSDYASDPDTALEPSSGPSLNGVAPDMAWSDVMLDPDLAADDIDPLWMQDDLDLAADTDLDTLVEDLEYEDDLGYDEDAATVRNLIQQLSQPRDEAPEPIIPAAQDEILLPDHEPLSASDLYQALPENPHDRPVAPAPADPPARIPTAESRSPASRLIPQRGPLWTGLSVGVISVALVTVFSVWITRHQETLQSRPRPSDLLAGVEELPTRELPNTTQMANRDLTQASTADVTELAIAAFRNGDLEVGQNAMEALFDRGVLSYAQAVFEQMPEELQSDPLVNFLKGRLAWQQVQTGNTDYSVDDARRYWEAAVRDQPDEPEYHNVLGFAYYAEDRPAEAMQAWLTSLTLIEEQQVASAKSQSPTGEGKGGEYAPTAGPVSDDPDALAAYAGLALASAQAAQAEPEDVRKTLLSKSRKLYQTVVTNDPIAYQPESLAQNWLWTEDAIADWQSLPTVAE